VNAGVTVDPIANTISAPVSHFTAFTVLAIAPPTPAPPPAVNWWLIGGIAAATAIVVGIMVWFFVFRRTR